MMARIMHRVFLPLALSGSLLALWQPGLFSWARACIPWLLGVIMFGMGMTLAGRDFRRVFGMPGIVLTGLAAQFVIMPLLAIGLSMIFGFEEALLVGMVLVGCSPGGTASNVIAYLGGANVALFTPTAFAAANPDEPEAWHMVASRERVEFTKRDFFKPRAWVFPRSDFEVDGRLPAPAL